jgi:hypothetical protein
MMTRLFLIEWRKIANYRTFWILFILYFAIIGFVLSAGKMFLQFLADQGADFNGINPTILPIYDFPDIWQNITFTASFFKVFLSFLIIISITNEISYRTIRQNIIDGLSRADFIKAKLLLVFYLSLANALFVALVGVILGLVYSPVKEMEFILMQWQFVPAFFLQTIVFLLFAFVLSLLVKKSGFTIILIAFYTYFIEPIATAILKNVKQMPEIIKEGVPYFPVKAVNKVIANPFPKYILREIQDFVAWQELAIAAGYLVLYLILIIILMRKTNW